MEGIRQWIEAEGSGHWFFIAFPVVLLCLFVWFKGRRVRFLIPSLLMSIIIINPLFYRVWDNLGLYAYWRILWIIPVIPVLAGLVPSLTERIQKDWIKTVVAAVGVGLVAFSGTFLYNGAGGSFVEAANASKLPDDVVQIADRLLELDEHPRVIAQDPIGVYLRQYTGEIEQLFGRDLYGHILGASSEAKTVNSILDNLNADLTPVATLMANDDYEYLVVDGNGREEQLLTAGFELIDTVAGYGIYEAHGTKTQLKQRNELGQVVSVTTIDENGKPVNGENGYATVAYNYDQNGNIVREFCTDVDGKGVADERGIAGYEREYDQYGHIMMERTLGVDKKPIAACRNYAEIHFEYEKDNVIKESYYDKRGKPAIQEAGHVAVGQVWDGNKIMSRTYLDDDGKLMNRIDGYSKVDWSGKDVVFYNTGGYVVPPEGINLFGENKVGFDGWSEWITPTYNIENDYIVIDVISLDKRAEGDMYTNQIEIEFKGVKATDGKSFLFATQGATDWKWDIGNIWNWDLMCLREPPEDGIESFINTAIINEKMVDASDFHIGFRCDNWADGMFRIRNVKIEKGSLQTEWTPGT